MKTAKTKTKTWLATSGTWRRTESTTTFEAPYGTVTVINDQGDTATAADDICTTTSYARNTATYLVALPADTMFTDCTANPSPTNYLGGARTLYDNLTTAGAIGTRALPTKTLSLASFAGTTPVWKQSGRTTYDAAHGRPVEQYDGLDNKTTYAYTPATGGPVTQVAVTNPLGHQQRTTLDRRGEPLTVLDANGKTTAAEYDPSGRLTKVWLPGNTGTTPNVEYAYTLRDTGANVITTKSLTTTGGQISSYELFDGQFRQRQTQAPSPDGKRVITDTRYDLAGLPTKSTILYNGDAAPGDTLVTFADTDARTQTRTTYDNLDRPLAEAVYSAGTERWRTTYTQDGDRTTATAPNAGTAATTPATGATTTLFDARGHTTELRTHQATTPTGTYEATRYAYNRLGALTALTDPAGNQWRFTVNLLGQVAEQTDPDAGTSRFTYTAAGDRETATDGAGEKLFYRYDALGRVTELRDDTATGFLRAGWLYDTIAMGHVTRSTRYVGSNAYTNDITGYAPDYQPTGARVVIPTNEGALAGTYESTATYHVNGAIATSTFPRHTTTPNLGGLSTETLTYGYDNQDRLKTLSTTYGGATGTYVTNSTYTKYGEPAVTTLSTGTAAVVNRSYDYDPVSRRQTQALTTMAATATTTPTTVADIRYSYDTAGNITKIADGATADNQCFSYDFAARLTTAWTPAGGDCAAAKTVAALGGPAKYS